MPFRMTAYAVEVGRLTKKDGERKFSMNQNLTLLFVWRRTLVIMIDAKRYQECEYQTFVSVR